LITQACPSVAIALVAACCQLHGAEPPTSTALREESAKQIADPLPDAPFVPTPQDVVDKMLEVAGVTQHDVLYDLGCGDGRVVVTAAKRYGCKAYGCDIDPERVRESQTNIKRHGVGHLVRVEQKDLFTLDLSPATVVTLYLLPELNLRLLPQLEKLKPGSRLVSHQFDIEGIQPQRVVRLRSDETKLDTEIFFFRTPLLRLDD